MDEQLCECVCVCEAAELCIHNAVTAPNTCKPAPGLAAQRGALEQGHKAPELHQLTSAEGCTAAAAAAAAAAAGRPRNGMRGGKAGERNARMEGQAVVAAPAAAAEMVVVVAASVGTDGVGCQGATSSSPAPF
eukprot:1161298-Pelagomonas_calceolata.AAC.10